MSPYYFLFCIQYEFMKKARNTKGFALKSPKSSEFAFFKQTVVKNRDIKKIKSYASGGIHTRISWGLRLRNTCAIGCAKKTAENVFKCCF